MKKYLGIIIVLFTTNVFALGHHAKVKPTLIVTGSAIAAENQKVAPANRLLILQRNKLFASAIAWLANAHSAH